MESVIHEHINLGITQGTFCDLTGEEKKEQECVCVPIHGEVGVKNGRRKRRGKRV